MKPIRIPELLTFNGGYVDAVGFIGLHGLFTAHVTGNFVTIGASLVNGTSGIVAKLLVLPMFCVVVVLARLFGQYLTGRRVDAVRPLAGFMVFLLLLAAGLAMGLRVGDSGDSPLEIAVGMSLVSAMAIQNVLHRVYFPKAPPTTLMTGSTTQLMIDLADIGRRDLADTERAAIHARWGSLATAIAIFAVGCGVAALAYIAFGIKALWLPPFVSSLVLLPHFRSPEAPA
jgi:uncharacterized membrane protein YoaK (UPF0700 family)